MSEVMNSAGRFRSILVAVDSSENAQRAARVAVELAKTLRATLTVLHVVEIPVTPYAMSPSLSDKPVEIDVTKVEEGARTGGEKLVSTIASLAYKSMGIPAQQRVVKWMGSAVEGITDYAERNGIDLIVVGTRGMGGFKKLLFGSVASGIVTYSKCAVLVVR